MILRRRDLVLPALFLVVLVATLAALTIQLSRDHVAQEEIQRDEKSLVRDVEQEIQANLRQGELSAADLAAWMMESAPNLPSPQPGPPQPSPPPADAPPADTTQAKQAEPDHSLPSQNECIRVLFDALYERFSTEMQNTGRNGLIFFGTSEGSLLAAGSYAGEATSESSRISFCDVVLGADFQFRKGNYFEFLVPPGRKQNVVSTFLQDLDRDRLGSTPPRHYDLIRGSVLTNVFQLLSDPEGCRPWFHEKTSQYDFYEKMNKRLTVRADKAGKAEAVYDATGRGWYQAAQRPVQPTGTVTTTYGLFELFDGVDWGIAALRKVHVEFRGGKSVDGVLAIQSSRSSLNDLLKNILVRTQPNRPVTPLAAVLIAPETRPGAVVNGSSASLSNDKPAPKEAAAPVAEAGADDRPLTDRQDNQAIIVVNPGLDLGLKETVDSQRRALARRVDQVMRDTSDWDKDTLAKPFSDLMWTNGGKRLKCEVQFVNVGGGNFPLPWKVGLIFPSSAQTIARISDDPFGWFENKTGLPALVLPLASLLVAILWFLRLRENRIALAEREAARQMAQSNAQQSQDILLSTQAHHAKLIRELEQAEQKRGQEMQRHEAKMDALREEALAERDRHHAQQVTLLERRQQRAARAGYGWALKYLRLFKHELGPLILRKVDPAIVLQHLNEEMRLVEAVLGRTTLTRRDELLSVDDVRMWVNNDAVVSGPELRVLTAKHLALRIISQLVENANKYQSTGEVICRVATRTILPPPAPAPPSPPAAPAPPRLLPPTAVPSSAFRRLLRRFLAPPPPRPAPPASTASSAPAAPLPADRPPAPVDEPESAAPPTLTPGLYFVACVSNLAPQLRRLPADKREEIFELFSEIAEQSRGTGMGLHAGRRLARMAHGNLVLRDGEAPDEIVFELWLPALFAELPAPAAREGSDAAAATPTAPGPLRAALVLDDDTVLLGRVARELSTRFAVEWTSDPMAFFDAVSPSVPVAVLDYDLGSCKTEEFADGLAVACRLRDRDHEGLLVLYTDKNLLPGDIETMQNRHVYHLPKVDPSLLGKQLERIEYEWAQDVTPPWRAGQFAALEASAIRAGAKLHPPDPEWLEKLIDESILDPILNHHLRRACLQCDGNSIEAILHRFLPHLQPS